MTREAVEWKRRAKGELNWLACLLWWTGCVRFHREGSCFVSGVFRWWHPLSWLVWFVALQWCGWVGEKVNDVVPFQLSPYWREHKDEIEWL